MAGYIGYDVAGIPGALVGIFATVAPSLILMVVLLGFLYKHKDSPKVKRMSSYVRPAIAVLLGTMTISFFSTSYEGAGLLQTIIIIVVSFVLLEKLKVHPAYVIIGALGYGAFFLA